MEIQNCPLRATRSRALSFSTEAYRPFFAFGIFYTVVVMALWFFWLHSLKANRFLFTFQISPIQAHFHWMIFGFTSFYLFGFLLTAFPKWVNASQPRSTYNLGLAAALFGSQILILMGTLISVLLLKVSLILESILFLFLLKNLLHLYFSDPGKKYFDQSSMVLIALSFGWIAQVFYQINIWTRIGFFYSLSLTVSQNLYLLFLMMSVSYRILPFFTARLSPETETHRGRFTLHFALGIIILFTFIESIPTFTHFFFLKGLLLILLGLIWLREIITWQIKKTFSNFLLFTHSVAFFWGIVFLVIKGFIILTQNYFLQAYSLQLALSHIFFIGCLSTLIWGISTRVTRGHGGLGFKLEKIDYLIFCLLQLAMIVRVILPFVEIKFPNFENPTADAAILWWFAFTLWGIRYFPVLIKKTKQLDQQKITQSLLKQN